MTMYSNVQRALPRKYHLLDSIRPRTGGFGASRAVDEDVPPRVCEEGQSSKPVGRNSGRDDVLRPNERVFRQGGATEFHRL